MSEIDKKTYSKYRGSWLSALWQLTLVRWREFIREPEAIFWTFVFPLLLAAGLGLAFRDRPPEPVHVGVVGEGLEAVQTSDAIVASRLADDSTARDALRAGEIAIIVKQDESGRLKYQFDPARPESRAARLTVDDVLQNAAGRVDPISTVDVTVSERGSRYIDFLIPGLLAMSIMGTGIWSIAFSIVTARNKKLLKRLVATPMSRMQYLMSFIVARFIFLVAEVGVLLAFGIWVFDVPIRGSFVSLFAVAMLAAFSFNALGLLLSSRAKTVEGVSGLANFVMFPMWIFSGVFFSSGNFPAAIQPFIKLLPLTSAVDALRGIMLRGASLDQFIFELTVLAVWLVVAFTVALRIFRWR